MTQTNLLETSFECTRIFFDDKNYPKGISRSGDYSIAEVKIIETYGVVLLELTNGTRAPTTEEEIHFVEVIHDNAQATTKIEKAWLKYLQKTRTPRKLHTLFGRSKVESDSETEESIDNSDIELS
jgi:uncharacterized protein YifE (UPF0438 family)